MKKIVFLSFFLIFRVYLNAQVFDQTVINTLQECIRQKQYERADSIISSFRKKDLSETSVFWLNLIHSDVGVSKYRQSRNAKVYIPYMQSGIDAFTFLSHYITKENASSTIDLWSFLFYWSDLFCQLDNTIIDSISAFSNKYYKDFERKDHVLYYLVRMNLYTRLHIKLQSNQFDNPKRMFFTFDGYLKAMECSLENRELIPEFFHNYEIFLNLNYLNLGFLYDQNQVISVFFLCLCLCM